MCWIDNVGSVATGGAALWAAVVASRGLTTWREQLSGRATYEVARRTLRGVLLVRDQISYARSPFILADEMLSAFRNAGIDPKTVQIPGDPRTEQLVYAARWKPLVEAMRELETETLEAEVLMGADIRKTYRELRGLVSQLGFAFEHHLRRRSNPEQWRVEEGSVDDELTRVFHSGFRPDVFGKEIEDVITKLENLLRPHLMIKSSRRLFSRRKRKTS